MNKMLGPDNVKGGISFTSPTFSPNGTGSSGGLNFDLPLASVMAFQDKSLSFVAANQDKNRAFFNQQTGAAQVLAATAQGNAASFINDSAVRNYQMTADSTARLEGINSSNNLFSFLRQSLMPKAKSGGGCYITTAICERSGKPDDCDELQTLRKFRDEFMQPRYPDMVREYYDVAPKIVARIKAQPDGGRYMLAMLETQYLRPAIAAIKAGDNESAMNYYVHMVAMADDLTTEPEPA